MATIENRSRFVVTVANRDDLLKTFPHSKRADAMAYVRQLSNEQGFKPKLSRENNNFIVRFREVGHPELALPASSMEEAVAIKMRIEGERATGLFIDYGKGRTVTLANLLVRYAKEHLPRLKSFETMGYVVNGFLRDAGVAPVDMAKALADHPNPHPTVKQTFKKRKAAKEVVRTPSGAADFLRKPFSAVVPDDINDYIDERCQSVSEATVDRELDLLASVCNLAIETWRIPLQSNLSPMKGVRRPRYFNERDRRLRTGEEARLLELAAAEDRDSSIERRLEELMKADRYASSAAPTKYKRKNIIAAARRRFEAEALATYDHVPTLEAYVQFQLMTAARLSEGINLLWKHVDLEAQTAFLPETKNGRPRTLPLRSHLVQLLKELPRTSERVFAQLTRDGLRKAWGRINAAMGLEGEERLRIHDLRHEAISRTAEAGANLPGGFSLVELQAFSGHRDVRMLLRYAHLSATSLAKRLDAAFGDAQQTYVHRGVRRLAKGASVSLAQIINAPAETNATAAADAPMTDGDSEPSRPAAHQPPVRFKLVMGGRS
ncbi:site-specific integrase [Roseateles sp. BYS96W]|uniref:Site-specific integrase n=1 Tax=Pelomonas nitida TaxID=3299027 RepID=A0ABW7G963_9BURK